jgi:microsomal dipeptidase-like Zn-dependent dipeptidase
MFDRRRAKERNFQGCDHANHLARAPQTLLCEFEVSQLIAKSMALAPVIFSQSGRHAVVDHMRDVPNDALALVKQNRGVVLVNFYPGYVSSASARWDADRAAEQARFNAPPYDGLYIGQPERTQAALADEQTTHDRTVRQKKLRGWQPLRSTHACSAIRSKSSSNAGRGKSARRPTVTKLCQHRMSHTYTELR